MIALTEVADVWPTALVRGRLHEREGCLLIADSVAVFPFGTEWEPPLVTFQSGESVEVDSRVRMGGGEFQIDELIQEGSPLTPVSDVRDCGDRTGSQRYVWVAPAGRGR